MAGRQWSMFFNSDYVRYFCFLLLFRGLLTWSGNQLLARSHVQWHWHEHYQKSMDPLVNHSMCGRRYLLLFWRPFLALSSWYFCPWTQWRQIPESMPGKCSFKNPKVNLLTLFCSSVSLSSSRWLLPGAMGGVRLGPSSALSRFRFLCMLSLLLSWHFSQDLLELPSGIITLHFDWVQYFLGGAAESGSVRGGIWYVETCVGIKFVEYIVYCHFLFSRSRDPGTNWCRNMRGNQICVRYYLCCCLLSFSVLAVTWHRYTIYQSKIYSIVILYLWCDMSLIS